MTYVFIIQQIKDTACWLAINESWLCVEIYLVYMSVIVSLSIFKLKMYSPKLTDLRVAFRRAFVQKMTGFQLQEINGDLFSAPKTHSLAHCVGADLAMGAGIAVKFKEVYGQVDQLEAQKARSGEMAVLKDDERYIYYLVTKSQSWALPTYESLQSSLEKMRDHMVRRSLLKIYVYAIKPISAAGQE